MNGNPDGDLVVVENVACAASVWPLLEVLADLANEQGWSDKQFTDVLLAFVHVRLAGRGRSPFFAQAKVQETEDAG